MSQNVFIGNIWDRTYIRKKYRCRAYTYIARILEFKKTISKSHRMLIYHLQNRSRRGIGFALKMFPHLSLVYLLFSKTLLGIG